MTPSINITKILILFVLILSSCTSDDEPTTLRLIFNQETAQDQMGDFADNAMEIYNGKVWSACGINSYTTPDFHHDIWESDNAKNWVSIADNFPVGRRGTTLTKFNDKLWIIAGENNAGEALQDIWSSSDGETWTMETDTAPFGAIQFHSTVVFDGKMYVIAGNSTTSHTEVWSSANGTDWTQNTSNAADAFFGRGGHKAVVFNNAIYVIGGEATTRLNDVWMSTNGTDWEQIAIRGDVLPRITGHSATVYKNKVWVIGGRAGTADFSNSIYYSSDMITWNKYDDVIPFDAIAFHNTLNYNDGLWVFGGYKVGGLSGAIWKIKEE